MSPKLDTIRTREKLLEEGEVPFNDYIASDVKKACQEMVRSAREQMEQNIDHFLRVTEEQDTHMQILFENREQIVERHFRGYATTRPRFVEIYRKASDPEKQPTINDVINDTLNFVYMNTRHEPQPIEGMAAYVFGHLLDIYYMLDPQKLSRDRFLRLVALNLVQGEFFEPFMVGSMYDDIQQRKGSDQQPYDIYTPIDQVNTMNRHYISFLTIKEFDAYTAGFKIRPLLVRKQQHQPRVPRMNQTKKRPKG